MITSSACTSRAISFDHPGVEKVKYTVGKLSPVSLIQEDAGKNDIFMVFRLYLSLATFRGSYLEIEKIANSAFCFSLS
jgi:hypothetical protein